METGCSCKNLSLFITQWPVRNLQPSREIFPPDRRLLRRRTERPQHEILRAKRMCHKHNANFVCHFRLVSEKIDKYEKGTLVNCSCALGRCHFLLMLHCISRAVFHKVSFRENRNFSWLNYGRNAKKLNIK